MARLVARNLKYFVAKFGLANIGDPIEGGKYPLESYCWPGNFRASTPNNPISVGDLVLLYCGISYPNHRQEIPAIGIVYSINMGDDMNTLWYHYLRLISPINRDTIRTRLTKAGLSGDLHNILDSGKSQFCFLRMISNAAAQVLLAGCQINWP